MAPKRLRAKRSDTVWVRIASVLVLMLVWQNAASSVERKEIRGKFVLVHGEQETSRKIRLCTQTKEQFDSILRFKRIVGLDEFDILSEDFVGKKGDGITHAYFAPDLEVENLPCANNDGVLREDVLDTADEWDENQARLEAVLPKGKVLLGCSVTWKFDGYGGVARSIIGVNSGYVSDCLWRFSMNLFSLDGVECSSDDCHDFEALLHEMAVLGP